MVVMISGLVLFLGIHLLPVVPPLRTRVATALGEARYRAVFSIVAALGLVLIIVGYWMRPERVQLFAPFASARAGAPLLVTLAFVLFAAANMRTHIRKAVRHPMLIGLMLWSGVHLLANGDLVGTVLFGSFFVYSMVGLVSAISRAAVKDFTPQWKHDAMAIAGALVLAYLTMRFHAPVFGTPAVV